MLLSGYKILPFNMVQIAKEAIVEKKHLHLWNIPKKYFPRKTLSKEYVKDLLAITSSLNYTNKNIQYSAQVCSFNIKSIIPNSHFNPKTEDVFKEIEEFVYHYENFCFRLYAYREKLMQFINAFLPVGYDEGDVKMRYILISPLVKQAGLISFFEKFKENKILSKVIEDRNRLTHRLYKVDKYLRPNADSEIRDAISFSEWAKQWRKEVLLRSQMTNKCTWIVDSINNSIATKLIAYKEQKV